MKFLKLKIFTFFTIWYSFILTAQNPNWSVNSANFSLDASVIAELQIDDIGFSDTNDIVAVFDENNEIRGVAKVFYVSALNKHLIFLTINGNTGGDFLTFKVYDFSENTVLDVPETVLEFIPNKITGDAENPFIIKAVHNFLAGFRPLQCARHVSRDVAHILRKVTNIYFGPFCFFNRKNRLIAFDRCHCETNRESGFFGAKICGARVICGNNRATIFKRISREIPKPFGTM